MTIVRSKTNLSVVTEKDEALFFFSTGENIIVKISLEL